MSDISVPHLVRTVRRFVDEQERVAGRSPAPRGPASPMAKEGHPKSNPEATKAKAPVTYQVSEQPSSRVQEEEFAKHCGWRATWPREARRHRGRWRRFDRRKRRSERDPLQRRSLKPPARKFGRENWRRNGGVRERWVRRCRRPVRGEGRSSVLRLGADKLAAKCFRALADVPQLRNLS